MTYAFAAAGTGGHVYPALAVADELVARGVSRDEIVFFGGDRMEATAVPDAGYRFVGVEIRGLRRSLSVQNLSLPAVVWRARRRMIEQMRASGTKVVLAMGGYVSVPAAMAARHAGASLFLHEQNAVPGLANRLIARWATRSLVAFPAAAGLTRATVVGNPLRRVFVDFDRATRRADGRKRYDLPDHLHVLGIMGGSLGAHVLNEAAGRIAAAADPAQVGIVHLTGSAHHQAVAATAAGGDVTWRTVAFEADMEHFYAAVDLVLGRAGAITVSELAATGTPSVLVPLAAVAQEGNAAYLVEAGAAVAVPQRDIDRVPDEVIGLLADDERRGQMAAAALAMAQPHAAARVADALQEAAV